MGQRVKRIENAVQGIEGNLELEDEPVVAAEEVMMVSSVCLYRNFKPAYDGMKCLFV